jgi:hypothetical protein
LRRSSGLRSRLDGSRKGAIVPLSTQRLTHNQVIFREVNERLRALSDGDPGVRADYLCECTDFGCTQIIDLVRSEYEAVRAKPKAFFVAPGHERLEVERVVDAFGHYTVVEKIVPLDDVAIRSLTSTDER